MKNLKDVYWYLEAVGGSELFEFSSHDEARKFGYAVREAEGDRVKVEIGLNSVRVKILEQECVTK